MTRPKTGRGTGFLLPSILFSALLLLAGCGERGPEAGEWRGTIDTLPGGAVRVSNPPEPLWGEDAGWRLVEELRIGSAGAEGPELFGDIRALEVDEEGRIYVLDRNAAELRIFGPDGTHLRTVGGSGSGPGEFRDPVGLAWGPGGTLWIVDPGNARITLVDREGRFLESRTRPIGGYVVPWPGGFSEDGELYDRVFVPGGGPGAVAFARFPLDLSRADTFRLPGHEPDAFEIPGRIWAPVPFTPTLSSVLDPEGFFWFGVTDRFRLVRTTLEGDTLMVVERPVEPERVEPGEREEALERLDWFRDQGGRVDPRRLPSTKPVFGQILLADDGHLWVTPFEVGSPAWSRFDVVDPDGRYLGPVEASPPIAGFPQPLIRGDHIHAVVRDELDVPYVARFRIVR